jgi:hypothetical protein
MAESCGGGKGSGQSGKAQGPSAKGGVMANVVECVNKLVTAGQILFSTQQGRILNNYAAPVKG